MTNILKMRPSYLDSYIYSEKCQDVYILWLSKGFVQKLATWESGMQLYDQDAFMFSSNTNTMIPNKQQNKLMESNSKLSIQASTTTP